MRETVGERERGREGGRDRVAGPGQRAVIIVATSHSSRGNGLNISPSTAEIMIYRFYQRGRNKLTVPRCYSVKRKKKQRNKNQKEKKEFISFFLKIKKN